MSVDRDNDISVIMRAPIDAYDNTPQSFYLTQLPVLPDSWRGKPNLVFVPQVQYLVETSKCHTEVWQMVLVVLDGHHVAYACKVRDQFGYGG
jgi:hypothetical protein